MKGFESTSGPGSGGDLRMHGLQRKGPDSRDLQPETLRELSRCFKLEPLLSYIHLTFTL